MSRVLHVITRAATYSLLAIVILLLVAFGVLQTSWTRERLRAMVLDQAATYLEGDLSIGALSGSLLGDLTLTGVALRQSDDLLFSADAVRVDYSIVTLLREGITLDELTLTRPVIHLRRDDRGWNITRLLRPRPAPETPQRRRAFAIRRITIDGGAAVVEGIDTPVRELRDLDAAMGLDVAADGTRVRIERLSARTAPTPLTLEQLTGELVVGTGSVRIRDLVLQTPHTRLRGEMAAADTAGGPQTFTGALHAERVSPWDLQALFPAVPIRTTPALSLRAQGPLSALAVEFEIASSAGSAAGTAVADLSASPAAVKGGVTLTGVDASAWTGNDALASQITGRLDVDLTLPAPGQRLPRGTTRFAGPIVSVVGYAAEDVDARAVMDGHEVRLNAGARAYGAHATADGVVTVPAGDAPPAYDIHGAISGLRPAALPRRLPGPHLSGVINARYHARGAGQNVTADAVLSGTTLEGARFSDDTRVRIEMNGRRLAYSAAGDVAGLDPQRVGRVADVAALAQDRFAGDITGSFDVVGSGRTMRELVLTARGDLRDTTFAGALIPRMRYDVTLDRGRLDAALEGRVTGLDPARAGLSGVPDTDVNGDVDVRATVPDIAGPVAVESLMASGVVMIDRSRVRGVRVDRARIDASLDSGVLRVADLQVNGPAITATASGTLALDHVSASDLRYRLEGSDIATIAKAFNQPLDGSITLDGRVTGTRALLTTAGTLSALRLKYGARLDALTLDTTYTASVPALDFAGARVEANTQGAFLVAFGTEITELAADVVYERERLQVRTDLRAAGREVSLAGDVILHPDHQEVHLTRFSLGTGEIVWSLMPGVAPRVEYGANRVAIDNLHLARAGQRLLVDGVFALDAASVAAVGGDGLDVRLERVELADIDRLLLGQDRMSGTLDATVRLTGSADDLDADGTLKVARGAVRGTSFEALTAKVGLAGERLEVDAVLRQSAASGLTARGHLPLALFRRRQGEGADAPGDELDLVVDTTALSLSLVQGVTTAVTDVVGTAEAHVRLAGTAARPVVTGTLDVAGGAFTVAATNTRYTDFNSRIRLDGDRALVESFGLLDDDGDLLRVTGALAIQERAVGDVNVQISADSFEVVDNQFGRVDVDTELRLTGNLQKPRLEGVIEFEPSEIDLEGVLGRVAADPYPTDGTTVDTNTAPAGGSDASASSFANLDLDVRFALRDAVVVRARDLRVRNAAVGLGAANITMGGDVRVRKVPGETTPRLFGDVAVVRGFYEFQGRRFDVLRGSEVRFQGFQPVDPALRITAAREITGVTAQVHIRGSVRQPQLTLSSAPPLDPADILSLIVFNQPVNQLGSAERTSLAERAGSLVAGAIADPIAGAIGDALDLDYFEIRATGDNGAGASVALGEQINEYLSVQVRQGIGGNDAREVSFEIRLAEFLRLVSSVTEGVGTSRLARTDSRAIDLIFLWTY